MRTPAPSPATVCTEWILQTRWAHLVRLAAAIVSSRCFSSVPSHRTMSLVQSAACVLVGPSPSTWQLVIQLDTYKTELDKTDGAITEFVNPK